MAPPVALDRPATDHQAMTARDHRTMLALAGGVAVITLTACGHSAPTATATSSPGTEGGAATAAIGPQSLKCDGNGFMNVGNAPLYGEPPDDAVDGPAPRAMADGFARRHRIGRMFPEAQLVLASSGTTSRVYAWEEPDGARRAYAAYEYVDSFGGWQSLGDAVCVPDELVAPDLLPSSAEPE
jgi:hypothetical protein